MKIILNQREAVEDPALLQRKMESNLLCTCKVSSQARGVRSLKREAGTPTIGRRNRARSDISQQAA